MNVDDCDQGGAGNPVARSGESPEAAGASSAVPRRSAAELERWMTEYLAGVLHTTPDQIDTSAPFDRFALDSVQAVGMTGDLEEWLGYRIDPMVLYDYPTIERLASHLAEQSS